MCRHGGGGRYGLDMDKTTDTELLEHARQGDPEALGTLVRRHDRYLYRVARSVLRDDLDDLDAEDIVQQTFLQAFVNFVDFRGESSLRTWLTRITINLALQRRRRRRSTVELSQVDTAQERLRSEFYLSSHTPSTPEHTAARSQIREILERAIDDLPPAFRTVLIFRDVEEASVEETANILGIKPQTVRTRLHRARRMLRDSLGEQFGAVLKDVFPFERPRCDALIRKLLIEVGLICQQQD
jgi:RNA polymerase sigma-70 factor, ECF subfamily